MERRTAFCTNCHKETTCVPKKVKVNQNIRDKNYTLTLLRLYAMNADVRLAFLV